MNERSHDSAGASFELPPEQQIEGWERHLEKSVEGQIGADAPSAAKTVNTSSVVDEPSILPQSLSVPADQGTAVALSDQAVGGAEEEREVIEKQWVQRAKEVIARNKDNPYKQKREVSRVKAEYMKARFNKVLKVEETA